MQSPELITLLRMVRQCEITHLTVVLIGNILWADCAKLQYYRLTAICVVSTKDCRIIKKTWLYVKLTP